MKIKKPKLTKGEVMIDIPDDPRLEQIKNFPHYLFRKDGMYHCGVCGKTYGKAMSKHMFMDKTFCPNCETLLEVKQITRRTNWENLNTEHRAQVVQVHQGRILFRQYSVVHGVNPETLKEEIEVDEIERTTVYQGEAYHFHWSDSYYVGWAYGTLNENDRKHRPKERLKFYPESFEELLKGTEIQYTGIGKVIDSEKDRWWYSISRYVIIAAHWPWIENVLKNGMTKLYMNIINSEADMRYITPKNIMKYRKSLKEKPEIRGSRFLKTKRIADKKKLSISDDIIDSIGNDDLELILAQFSKMNIDKVVRYINNQSAKFNAKYDLQFYRDYMEMMKQVGTPISDDITTYPPNLKKAHDDAIRKLNTIKQEKNNGSYVKYYFKLKELNFSKGGLMIVVPTDVIEIIIEGQELGHCVGSYVDRVAKGQTAILFVRRSESPLQAFYTMEYNEGKVIQCRGHHNADTTPEVKEFIREWLEWTKAPKKKPKREFIQMQPVAA